MIKVEAIVREEKFEDVKAALNEIPFVFFTQISSLLFLYINNFNNYFNKI